MDWQRFRRPHEATITQDILTLAVCREYVLLDYRGLPEVSTGTEDEFHQQAHRCLSWLWLSDCTVDMSFFILHIKQFVLVSKTLHTTIKPLHAGSAV